MFTLTQKFCQRLAGKILIAHVNILLHFHQGRKRAAKAQFSFELLHTGRFFHQNFQRLLGLCLGILASYPQVLNVLFHVIGAVPRLSQRFQHSPQSDDVVLALLRLGGKKVPERVHEPHVIVRAHKEMQRRRFSRVRMLDPSKFNH